MFLLSLVKVIYMEWEFYTGSLTTPDLEGSLPAIPRQKFQKVGDITHNRTIPISSYIPADKLGFSKIKLLPVLFFHIYHHAI